MGPLPPTPTSTAPKSKLRDSCHNCATSKLKCSKDKPTCARCERRGKKCEYYATKRAGRKQPKPSPTADSSTCKDAPTHATIEPHVGLAVSEPDTVNFLWGMDLLPSPDASSNASSGSTLGNFMVPFDFDNILGTPTGSDMIDTQRSLTLPSGEAAVNGGVGADGDDAMDNRAGTNSLPADDLSFLSNDFLAIDNITNHNHAGDKMDINFDGNSLMSGSLVNSPFAQTSSGQLSVHDRGHSSTREPACNCLIRALDLLRRLGTDSPNCTHASMGSRKLGQGAQEALHSNSRQPTIDRLITDNRETIETTINMLECSCSQDGYLLSIMTFIAFKVLGTYAVAMRGGTTLGSDNSEDYDDKDDDYNTTKINSQYHTNRSTQSLPYSEHLVRSSMIAPSYCFDVEEQGRMVAQQIMGELHRVQRLVNSLSQRLRSNTEHVSSQVTGTSHSTTGYSEGKASGSQTGGIPVPLSATLMGQLETDLRKHLRAVSGQILNVLRQS